MKTILGRIGLQIDSSTDRYDPRRRILLVLRGACTDEGDSVGERLRDAAVTSVGDEGPAAREELAVRHPLGQAHIVQGDAFPRQLGTDLAYQRRRHHEQQVLVAGQRFDGRNQQRRRVHGVCALRDANDALVTLDVGPPGWQVGRGSTGQRHQWADEVCVWQQVLDSKLEIFTRGLDMQQRAIVEGLIRGLFRESES
ncbi:hypothetical protein PspLS_11688 [Pyricularia sp. CBS 133598]|nr:hypothetical protein PspLS_11688 [Pyricularia sp. CBS 133598]